MAVELRGPNLVAEAAVVAVVAEAAAAAVVVVLVVVRAAAVVAHAEARDAIGGAGDAVVRSAEETQTSSLAREGCASGDVEVGAGLSEAFAAAAGAGVEERDEGDVAAGKQNAFA